MRHSTSTRKPYPGRRAVAPRADHASSHRKSAFTLIELLAVIAIIVLLAALLLPAVSRAKDQSRKSICSANLKQVNLAILLYSQDSLDSLPTLPEPDPFPNGVGAFYKQLVKGYLGLGGPASPNETVFTCPSDSSVRKRASHAFSSYTFNGYEVPPGALPRITGTKVSSIRFPTRAVLVAEYPAFWGGSWHPNLPAPSSNANAVLSFVDAHIRSTRIYWDGITGSHPSDYEPPAPYEYSWDGD